MHLDTPTIVALSICELVALLTIVNLWFRKRRMRVVTRLLWSVVLLVPLFGVLFYGLTRPDPDAHWEDVGDHSSGGGVGDTGHH
jgi:hypothetical protein